MRLAIAAFIAGGSLLLFLPTLPKSWVSLCILTSFISGLAYLLTYQLRGRLYVAKVCLAILFFALGFAWNAQYAKGRLQNILSSEYDGKDFVLEGRINALPQSSASGVKFSFEVDSVAWKGEKLNGFPRQIYLSWQPAWRNPQDIPNVVPGQRWKLRVKLKRPYGSLNPYTFDFERWAFHQNFGASGSVRSGELLIEKDIGFTELALEMEYQRWKLRNKIQRLLPIDARYGGVISALVMGDQNAIDQDDWRVFNITGIGHLISISGLHVTMLAGLGAGIAAFLWSRNRLPLLIPVSKVAAAIGFLTAFIYACLAGFQIPAQRTMYMVGVVAFALWSGRNPRSFDIWCWALVFVLLFDPMAPYTPGFWLSFGAVAAILYAMKDSGGLLGIPTGKELEMHWSEMVKQALLEACRVQAVVTMALLPLTLYWFYQVSIVSPLANALAIPLVSYVVTPLAIGGALLPEFMGAWLLLIAHISMEYLAMVLSWMASWSWSFALSHQPDWWVLAIATIGVVIVIRPGSISESWKSRIIGLTLSGILFIKPITHRISMGHFTATVLDIGQGTAVLIETANKKLLYDTGPIQGKKDDAGKRIILPFLRGRGINQIDRMVISHSDTDHVGGAATLLQEIRFDFMMGSLPDHNPLLANLSTQKVPSIPCRYGQDWVWDDVEFYIWHPHKDTLFTDTQSGKPNEMSCVLEIRNKTSSLWLTGDVEKRGEADIIARLNQKNLLAIQDKELILMAPHHGSKTSSSMEFLKKLAPDQAFAQNGYGNRYGHPHSSVTARYESLGIPFYQTPATGMQTWKFTSARDVKEPAFQRDLMRRIWHRLED